MINLVPDHQAALQRVIRAGERGLPLDDLTVSAAVTLGIYGLADITEAPDQRVIATRRGRAYRLRDAYA